VLLINPPIILVLVVLVIVRIPRTPGHPGTRLDLPGALTVTAALAALIFGVTEGEQRGFADATAWGALAVAVALGVVFIGIERSMTEPMLPAALLRGQRAVTLGAVLVLGAGLAGYVYFTSLYLQRVVHLAPGITGLALGPASAMVLLTSTQASRRLLPRLGTTWQLVVAFALMCGGQLWLAQATAHGNYVADVLGPILITSAGVGLALPAASLAVTHEAPVHQRGIAGALFAASQQAGSAVGLAVLAAAAAASTASSGQLISGYQLAFLIVAALAAVTAVALGAATRIRSTPAAT
jgi:hypothetical protein